MSKADVWCTCESSVKWKVLIMRQVIKQGQPNFRVFFHDFADSQRVPFTLFYAEQEAESRGDEG